MTILAMRNVHISAAGTNHPILCNINFDIHQNDFVVLLGHNGSGKSTLLTSLYKNVHAKKGVILLAGKNLTNYSKQELGNAISVLTQNTNDSLFLSATVFENFLMFKSLYGIKLQKEKAERSTYESYIAHYSKNLVNKLDHKTDRLSGGEKQILALALCFLKPPKLLLLDENTSALDPKAAAQVMQLTQRMVTEHHVTCIMTTHNLDLALEYGNKIFILSQGNINKIFDMNEKKTLTKSILLLHYFNENTVLKSIAS